MASPEHTPDEWRRTNTPSLHALVNAGTPSKPEGVKFLDTTPGTRGGLTPFLFHTVPCSVVLWGLVHSSSSKGADTSAVDDRGRVPKRLASRKEISKLLAAKETESKVGDAFAGAPSTLLRGRGCCERGPEIDRPEASLIRGPAPLAARALPGAVLEGRFPGVNAGGVPRDPFGCRPMLAAHS